MVANLGSMLAKPSYSSLEELQLKAALYFLTKGVVRVLDLKMFCKIMSRLGQEVLFPVEFFCQNTQCRSVHSSNSSQ